MKHRTLIAATIVFIVSLVVIPAYPVWAAPLISLSPTYGAAGTRVEVSGTNFDSYVGDYLSVYFDDQLIPSSPVMVSAPGQFTVYFDVPDYVTPGTVIVSVKGPFGSILAETYFTIPTAEIELSVTSATIGATVEATGWGFYADRYINFVFAYDSKEISLGSTLSDPTGQYQHEFAVPTGPAGVHQVIARDDEGNLAVTGLEIVPSVVVSPASGVYEDTIEIEGIGFSSGSPVTIYLGTTPIAYGESNTIGSFEGTFNVPELALGVYNLWIVDENGYTAQFQFSITAGIWLNLTAGHISAPVIISGTGYAVGVTVSIYYDDVRVALATADEFGSFSATFEVPPGVSGEHTVTASAGSVTRQLVFAVESTPPLAPRRLQPTLNNEELPPAGFIWELVDDDSQPVTYTLQIAKEVQFEDVLVEKTGLVAPQYALSGADRLPSSKEGAPYYWRVKAVDAASNEGEWSTVGSFYWTSFSLPLWTIIVLIAAGVLIIGFLVYWMIRRRARYGED
ncbi:MAG TPA: hypothetical protein G4O18_09835 [Dehalococcoidia bacterium]|nr:hypothetical protein [Dehalococcoidia bacterium]